MPKSYPSLCLWRGITYRWNKSTALTPKLMTIVICSKSTGVTMSYHHTSNHRTDHRVGQKASFIILLLQYCSDIYLLLAQDALDIQVLTGNLISLGEGGVFTGVLSVTSTTSLIGLRYEPSGSLLMGLLPNSCDILLTSFDIFLNWNLLKWNVYVMKSSYHL